jgi:hypothetical protein
MNDTQTCTYKQCDQQSMTNSPLCYQHRDTGQSNSIDSILTDYSFAVQDLIAGHKPFDDGKEASRYRAQAKAQLEQLIATREAKYRSSISYAIGYCQGVGHPCEYLEQQYPDIAALKSQQRRES